MDYNRFKEELEAAVLAADAKGIRMVMGTFSAKSDNACNIAPMWGGCCPLTAMALGHPDPTRGADTARAVMDFVAAKFGLENSDPLWSFIQGYDGTKKDDAKTASREFDSELFAIGRQFRDLFPPKRLVDIVES